VIDTTQFTEKIKTSSITEQIDTNKIKPTNNGADLIKFSILLLRSSDNELLAIWVVMGNVYLQLSTYASVC